MKICCTHTCTCIMIQNLYSPLFQFDRGWFNDGNVPSLPGGAKFPHSEAIKKSHNLSAALYQLKKMVHSSKVKLEAGR